MNGSDLRYDQPERYERRAADSRLASGRARQKMTDTIRAIGVVYGSALELELSRLLEDLMEHGDEACYQETMALKARLELADQRASEHERQVDAMALLRTEDRQHFTRLASAMIRTHDQLRTLWSKRRTPLPDALENALQDGLKVIADRNDLRASTSVERAHGRGTVVYAGGGGVKLP